MAEIWHSLHWPTFTYDKAKTEQLLAQSAQAVGQVVGLVDGLGKAEQDDLRMSQIAQEAIASFRIEGVSLDPGAVEASVIASLKHRNQAAISRRSDAVVELMLDARTTRAPMTQELVCGWHRLLFFGIEVEDLGEWRSFELEIVRSATAGTQDVLYKAPPPDRIADEMAVFFDWLNRPDDTPTAVRAALAHLWFESIHPFSDGNGRIGRALIEYVFAGTNALPFSFSRQVERDKKAYYQALQDGRTEGQGGIDATAFVTWFLQTLLAAATHSKEEARFIVRKNQFFWRFADVLTGRQMAVLEKLFEQGADRVGQGVSSKSYCRIANVSTATSTRDLSAMEKADALRRSEAGGRSTLYWVNF